MSSVVEAGDDVTDWDMKNYIPGKSLATGGDAVPGEMIDLRTGTLHYNQQDLTIPGNGGMAISVGRSFGGEHRVNKLVPYDLGNWRLDTPQIVGNRPYDIAGNPTDSFCRNPYPGKVNMTKSEKRSYSTDTENRPSTTSDNWTITSQGQAVRFTNSTQVVKRLWAGLKLYVPGEPAKDLLFRDGLNVASTEDIPNIGAITGVQYVTTDHWQVTCIDIGVRAGAGFEVQSPDGRVLRFTRDYYPRNPLARKDYPTASPPTSAPYAAAFFEMQDPFTRIVYHESPDLDITYGLSSGSPADFYAPVHWVATEVTDRNGNKIYYDYDASPDSMGKLNLVKIRGVDSAGGDARDLTLAYYGDAADAGKLLQSVTGAGRTVTYTYANNQLTKVTRGDGSWKYCYYGASGCTAKGTGGQIWGELESATTPFGGKVSYLYKTINAADYYFGYGTMVSLISRTITDNTVTSPVAWTWEYGLFAPYPSTTFPGAVSGTTELQTRMEIKSPDAGSSSTFKSDTWDYYTFAATRDWMHGQLRYTRNHTWPTLYDWKYLRKAGNGLAKTAPIGEYVVAPVTVQIGLTESATRQIVTYQYPKDEPYGQPENIKTDGYDKNVLTSRTIAYTYDNKTANGKYILGLVKSETYQGLPTGSNKKIVREFDGNGNLQREERFAAYDTAGKIIADTGSVTKYTYLSTGDLETRIVPRGYTEYFRDYKRGLPQSVTNVESNKLVRVVNDDGTVASETDYRGVSLITSYKYDGAGRVKLIVPPEGDSKVVQWSGNTRKEGWDATSTGVIGSAWTETTLDGFGRDAIIAEKTNATPEGFIARIVESTKYDALGRPVYRTGVYTPSTGEAGKYNVFTYDRFGGLSTITEGISVTKITSSFESIIIYSPRNLDIQYCATFNLPQGYPDRVCTEYGTRSTPVDVTTAIIDLSFPRSRSVVKELQINADVTQKMARDALGRVTSIVFEDKLASTTKVRNYEYNTEQFLWKVTNPETGITELKTDAAGNVTRRQVGSSPATTMAYYPSNLISSIDYASALTPDVSFEYNANGNPKVVKNTNAIWTYHFDANNHLDNETVEMGMLRFSFGHSYNTKQAVTGMTYPSGMTLDYSPDAWGAAGAASPYVASVKRWGNAAWKEVKFKNGRTTTSTLEDHKWPSTIATDGDVMSLGYTYDANGNTASLTRSPDTSYNVLAGALADYDHLGRLRSQRSNWGGSTLVSDTIGYDGYGNITSQSINGRALSYNYDQTKNLLDSITGITGRYSKFSYDAYGNVTGDGSYGYVYDEAGNLTTVSPPLPKKSTVYSYDGHGRIVKRQNSIDTAYIVYGLSGKRLLEYRPGDDASLADDKLTEFYYLDGQQVASRELTALDKVNSDGDVMSDAYELKYGLNAGLATNNNATGFDDRDDDNVSDLIEFQKGMNPADKDSDHDGVEDGQELLLGLNPLKGDTDGDGLSDSVELAQGRNPKLNEAALMTIINSLLLN